MANINRRELLRSSTTAAAGFAAAALFPRGVMRASPSAPRLRFGVIGMNHGHIYGQVDAVTTGGGELVAFHAREPELAAAFARRYPSAKQVSDERAVLDDPTLAMVISSIVPDQRASLGIRVMRHGKDFLVDKPGATTLAQLEEVRRAQAATGRIYSILYGERLENGATVRAAELVREGAIGRVVQTVGLGPHRIHPPERPSWFWDPGRHGGILCDIACTSSTSFSISPERRVARSSPHRCAT